MIQQKQEWIVAQNLKKKKQFRVGEEVLCWNSARKTHYSGKLKLKWKGSYVIAAILLNKTYKIADQGGVLRTPVNGDRLKLYNWRFLESIMMITDKSQKFILKEGEMNFKTNNKMANQIKMGIY